MIIIESEVIYSYEEFTNLLLDNAKEHNYYLIYDDLYFEEIKKDQMITREVYDVAKRFSRPLSIPKYMKFKVKDNYTTSEVYKIIDKIRKDTCILVTTFNPNEKQVFFIFISNKNDFMIKQHIERFLEMEGI